MVSSQIITALAALLAALPGHVSAGLYTKNSPVLQLDGKSYDRLIAQSNYTSIVEFYAPWCGHCKNLQPAYEKAAKALSGLAKVAAVDCDEEANKAFCGSMGVQGFPTLKIVKPGKKPGRPIVEDYQGQRTAKAIVEAVTDKIPNLVRRVQDKDLETFLAGTTESGEPMHKAILFSDKGKTSALIKAVAIEFKGSISMAQIRSAEKASVELLEVEKFPSLVLLPAGDKADRRIYDGEMNKAAMVKFLSQVATPNADPAPPRVKLQGKDKKTGKAKAKDDAQARKSQESFERASASHASSEKPITATDETMEPEVTESPSPEVDAQKPIALPDPAPAIPLLEDEDELLRKCLGPKTGTCILALMPVTPNVASRAGLEALAEIAHKYRVQKRPIFPFYAVPATNPAAKSFRTEMVFRDDEQMDVIALSGRWGWWRHLAVDDFYSGGATPEDTDSASEETTKQARGYALDKITAWVDRIRLDDGWKKYLPTNLMPQHDVIPGSDGVAEGGPEDVAEGNVDPPAEPEAAAAPDVEAANEPAVESDEAPPAPQAEETPSRHEEL